MKLPRDFRELLVALNKEKVRYLVVGAHAVAVHAEPRFTQDLDLWVEPTRQNAARVWRALTHYGAPLGNVVEADFTVERQVFQMGIEPTRIDILMGIDGASFTRAWSRRTKTDFDGVSVNILSREDLIRSKKAANRPQDRLDLKRLTRHASKKQKTSRKRRRGV